MKKLLIITTLLVLLPSFQAQALNDEVKDLIAAEKAIASGKAALALRHSKQIQTSELGLWKRVLQAEAYNQLEQYHSTLALLRNLKKLREPEISHTSDGYAQLYARALLARLEAKRALQQSVTWEATQLVAFYPLSDAVLNQLSKEEQELPLRFEQRLKKMNRLAHGFAFKQIVGLVAPREITSSRLKTQDKCEAYYTLGRSLRSSKNHWPQAQSALESIGRTSKCSKDLKAKALYYLGLLGRAAKNMELYLGSFEALASQHPNHRLGDDALYYLARYYKKAGSRSQANKYLKKLNAAKNGDMRMEYHFDEGFGLFKKAKYTKAAKSFDKAAENKGPINEVYVRNLYWQARSLKMTGSAKKEKQGKDLFKRIAKDYPFSFYAVLSAKKLGTSVKVPKSGKIVPKPPAFGQNLFELIDTMNDEGFGRGARTVLDIALEKHPELKTRHKEFLVAKFIESGNYREALEIAADHFGTGVYGPVDANRIKEPLFAAFYPEAYRREMRKGYRISGLPKGAIEGITREESLFKRDAKSWVGATGLMQLMPSTAKLIQGDVSQHTPSTSLTNPQTNIILGSHYLKLMYEKFDEQLPLAIMAYNAGPGNVNKWLKRVKRGQMKHELDLFIEEIPFRETRGYVKRVMRTMNVYGSYYKESFFLKNMFSLSVLPEKTDS